MYFRDELDQEEYTKMVLAIKMLNEEKKDIKSSKAYKLGNSMLEKKKEVREKGMEALCEILKRHSNFKKGEKYSMASAINAGKNNYGSSNFFSTERIAVYTCIIGGYDSVQEPLLKPDNCDYYAVTDFEIPAESKWKRIDVALYDGNCGSSQVMKNRFFKMHPDILFPDYKYSVYVDGNIRICTDMTEYVNRISDKGTSCFAHSQRDCVYEEALACVAMGKVTNKNVEELVKFLKEKGMPEHYGMVQCSLIVREHNNLLCKKLMNEWWEMFCTYAKRDQLSLPFVLFDNAIKVEDIATLGGNIYKEDSFEVVVHQKR